MPIKKPNNLTQWEWMVQRFWAGVEKKGADECWPWLKAKVTDGYGTIALQRGVSFATHRLAYRLAFGSIPEGMQVLHTCDNRACCNHAHLFLGTNRDNIEDMLNKRRGGKLTAQQIEEIKLDQRKQRIIAQEHGINQSMVSLIKKGKRWATGIKPFNR